MESPPVHKTRVATMGREQFNTYERDARRYMAMLDNYTEFDGFVRARDLYQLRDLIIIKALFCAFVGRTNKV